MKIEDLIELYAHSPQAKALSGALSDTSKQHITINGLAASAASVLFAAAMRRSPQTILFVLNDADEAGYFYHDMTQLTGTSGVLFFPGSTKARLTEKNSHPDAANEILRTEAMAALTSGNDKQLCVVTYPEAIAEEVVSREHMEQVTISVKAGEECDFAKLEERLRELGFTEVDYVYEPGQFAVRGSIVDVFSYSSEYPFRIDFFGDEVDSIRTFEVDSQLSKEKRDSAELVPEMKEGSEMTTSFFKFLPKNTIVAMKNRQYTSDIVGEDFDDEVKAFRTVEFGMIRGERREERGEEMETGRQGVQGEVTVNCEIEPQPLFHKNFDLLIETFSDYIKRNYKIYILADSPKQQDRLRGILEERGERSEERGEEREITFTPVDHTLHEGFVNHALGLCIFTDHQIFDRFHKYTLRSDVARKGKAALTLKEIQEMEIGDYVVHIDLGVGRFAGLVRIPIKDGHFQEAIRITYANNDKVDVSIHSLYKISKYRRKDGETQPRLSTLGTGAWERMKERTKKRIKDIARDLIKLYAARRREKGFAFGADTYLQQELEASFLYEDTPDQLKATNDVKADMESSQPMDRLVCGDVGFGKTEVAVRAAFKAASDSKQVAVLVPTTVLALQHYQTFSSRLKGMPVRVDYLSRARTAKQTTQVLKDLEEGRIDIIIGTHKLIGKSVKFKDLGLLIIDEEQKFGVSVKEKLRQMKTNVDTLTMSATPIPRTLQFSLMGARDMSIIRTAPPNRYPIHTEVTTFSGEVIAEAIKYEMSRNGQVFFVNDNIKGLAHIAQLIARYVPDARVAIGHGQMKPDELEKVVVDFMNYDYDVLLSTTIVENGIDIPNANTIIINDAHRFGLSDLHQMRGRVGRSNKKAFCFLLAPPLSSLSVDSRRRLEALETFSDLGSGFNLSMQDLDIRGAGNLLGAEQSGFMEDLGYETYMKILSQAMVELRNEGQGTKDEGRITKEEGGRTRDEGRGALYVDDCTIESDLEMYFPDVYVPSSSERMLLYRELENLRSDADVERFRTELRDRFGELPKEGEELLQVVTLRRLGKRLGCEKIMLKQGQMYLYFVSNDDSPYYQSETFDKIINYATTETRRSMLREVKGKRSMLIKNVPTACEAVSTLRTIGVG